ncbi:MAG: RsmE family RNA methyltransferase [Candidatus Tokpelaia sp.]|nr:MAG: RsmE family RNA methyltransferase [Candidatus Tokpelaia sp.]KAA6205738.1 MAG: RsmE family RNA methyltransferase [Candidatus Tokpelaia sp.]
MRANYKMQRLFVEAMPKQGAEFSLSKEQTHYLLHVLRLQQGQDILLFDGKGGEWRAHCLEAGKKSLRLRLEEQTRRQDKAKIRLVYCFAPLKGARLDYMVQKAVEMGVNFFQPVLTQHTQIYKLNSGRLKANIMEAAEQCGQLSLASLAEPLSLAALLQGWQQQWGREARLIFADEAQITPAGAEITAAEKDRTATREKAATAHNPLPVLLQLKAAGDRQQITEAAPEKRQEAAAQMLFTPAAGAKEAASPAADREEADMRQEADIMPTIGLLIGPEGGFSAAERRLLYAQDFITAIPLGPRILRADTAATAALALIQTTLGDW